jgi:hypothetical protein
VYELKEQKSRQPETQGLRNRHTLTQGDRSPEKQHSEQKPYREEVFRPRSKLKRQAKNSKKE